MSSGAIGCTSNGAMSATPSCSVQLAAMAAKSWNCAAGTIVHVTSWHDNTSANKYNPNPRNWVGYGQRTMDEMSFAWVSLFYIDDAEYEQRMNERMLKLIQG